MNQGFQHKLNVLINILKKNDELFSKVQKQNRYLLLSFSQMYPAISGAVNPLAAILNDVRLATLREA